jgi:hypothetical protein
MPSRSGIPLRPYRCRIAVTGPAAPKGEKRNEMLNLKMIIGSTRPGRAADRVIPWITTVAAEHGAFSAGARQ